MTVVGVASWDWVKRLDPIRLFAATDGYPISVKNEIFKNIFLIFFQKKYIFKKSIFNTNWISIRRRK